MQKHGSTVARDLDEVLASSQDTAYPLTPPQHTIVQCKTEFPKQKMDQAD